MTGDSVALRDRVGVLERRVSELSGAAARIGASLDPDAVLQEIVDSARALTGARYALIATVDEAGPPRRLVGSGLTAAEYRHWTGWADAPQLFEHLRRRPDALRFEDVPAYLRSRGFAADVLPFGSARGTPIDSRGARVGYLFLADKRGGGDFTAGDEEVLPLFASHAGTAIANARAFRDEQRARGRLEALVATSPVGVVPRARARTGGDPKADPGSRRRLQPLAGDARPLRLRHPAGPPGPRGGGRGPRRRLRTRSCRLHWRNRAPSRPPGATPRRFPPLRPPVAQQNHIPSRRAALVTGALATDFFHGLLVSCPVSVSVSEPKASWACTTNAGRGGRAPSRMTKSWCC